MPGAFRVKPMSSTTTFSMAVPPGRVLSGSAAVADTQTLRCRFLTRKRQPSPTLTDSISPACNERLETTRGTCALDEVEA